MSAFVKIAAEIDRLQRSANVDVRFSQDGPLLTGTMDATKTRQALGFLKFEVPPSVAKSVEIESELSAYWKSRTPTGKEQVTGEFCLRPVLLFGLDSELDPVFKTQRYDGVDLEATRVFDYYAKNGGPIFALMAVADGVLDDKVLVFDEERLYRTSLRYETYLERVRQTRGFLFWQYLFCEGIELEKQRAESISRGLAFVEREFRGEDYSDLWARLERIAPGTSGR